MNRLLFIFCLLPVTGCTQYGKLDLLAQLPKKINEGSGITTFDGKTIWLIEDGSNPSLLREINTQGELLRSLDIEKAKNEDWEALTKDGQGNLYIGDFGNNQNERKNLAVYRLPGPITAGQEVATAEKIRFSYPEQHDFPPKKSGLFFDVEAFFHHGAHLYLVTKNRARPFDGTATVYRLPDQPGEYQAEQVARIRLCDDARSCLVTDAALSPNGTRLVLLSYGKLWVYEHFTPGVLGKQEGRMIDLQTNTQLEAVCFASDTLLYLADERSLGRGGNLYSLPLPPSE